MTSVLEAAIVSEALELVVKVGPAVCGGEVFRCHNETDVVGNSLGQGGQWCICLRIRVPVRVVTHKVPP